MVDADAEQPERFRAVPVRVTLHLAAVHLPGLPQEDVVEGPGYVDQGGPVHPGDRERLVQPVNRRAQGGGDGRLEVRVLQLRLGDGYPRRGRTAGWALWPVMAAKTLFGDGDVGAEDADVIQ